MRPARANLKATVVPAQMNNLHVISWEKGYKNDKWDENKSTKTGSLIQMRNNKTDTKLITYQYQELRWDKKACFIKYKK